MVSQSSRWLGVLVCLACLLLTSAAQGRRTRLLEVDLRTGAKRRIDAKGPRTSADRELDSMLGATMGRSFSTKDLEKIAGALRRYLKSMRLRASARMVLFLYPGRTTSSALKEMREVLVDVDLEVDPCARAVCRDAVAKHVELVGRALKQAVLRTRNYSIRFKSVTVRTVVNIGGGEQDQYRFTANDVVNAGRSGGGAKLVGRLNKARAGYDAAVLRALKRRLRSRRVRLAKPARLSRDRKAVVVKLQIRSDRVRVRSHVTDALAATARVLFDNPHTPHGGEVTVVAHVRMRGSRHQTFRTTIPPLRLFARGKLSRAQLWDNYVIQQKKGGQRLTFNDDEARGRSRSQDSGPDRTGEILSANVSKLASCLQAEARRSRRFKGVTLRFAISRGGKATGLRLSGGRASASLRRCLAKALGRIRFQRHGGAPRQVSYPLYIQR